MSNISVTERKRLASILGMLGSDQIGERDNAARLAEKFRLEHNLSWSDLLTPTALVTTERPTDTYRPAANPPPRPRSPSVDPADRTTKNAKNPRAATVKQAKSMVATFFTFLCMATLWIIFGWKDTLLIMIIMCVFETFTRKIQNAMV